MTWEKSTIRSFLNNYGRSENASGKNYSSKGFLDCAFNNSERSIIKPVRLINADNSKYDTEGGRGTVDKVFLLSESDIWMKGRMSESYGFVREYLVYDEARRCKTSTYAHAMGAYRTSKEGKEGNCWWWLRSPGNNSTSAAGVHWIGWGFGGGGDVSYKDRAVRPALYLDLSSPDFYSFAGTVCSDGTVEEKTPICKRKRGKNKRKMCYKIIDGMDVYLCRFRNLSG